MYSKKFAVIAVLILSIVLSACVGSGAQQQERNITANNQAKMLASQPVPSFDWSLERDVFIQIYYLRNEAAATYTVVTNSFGQTMFECASIGYPLAADMQLTNPLQPYGGGSAGYTSIEMPEPNGLYSSKNTVGTWVLCTLPTGEIYPVYTEQNATAWPFPVVRDQATGMYVPVEGAKPVKTIDVRR